MPSASRGFLLFWPTMEVLTYATWILPRPRRLKRSGSSWRHCSFPFEKVAMMIGECSHLLEESFNDFVKYTSYICARALDIMRNKDREPRKQLELLLRIIEIDHKIDERYESLNVTIKQRPHCWRRNFFELIEQRIQERIEVFHVEKKSNNENWIARSEQLLGMPFLQVNAFALLDDYPLLPDAELERLQDQFINATKSEVCNWAIKAIRQEVRL
uniref:RPW8 domain-containing protein n=1 Tax=Ascaris lumbricoides TaxID=6252 RepID=A0A0M3ILV9_ASCLU